MQHPKSTRDHVTLVTGALDSAKALAGHSATALLDMWAATESTDNGSTASAVRRPSDDASGLSERSSVDHGWHVKRQRRLRARSAVGRASSG